jgi:hypothetical protein
LNTINKAAAAAAAAAAASCRYPAGLSPHDFRGLFGYKVTLECIASPELFVPKNN